MSNRILVTGADGQLGLELKQVFIQHQHSVFYTIIIELDLTNK
jgi:dTDP-4-dehydrorhamnose reductase